MVAAGAGPAIGEEAGVAEFAGVAVLAGVESVSYTNLDVYKRQ